MSNDSVLEKENEAKRLSQQWNGESIRHSIDLYVEVADEWIKLGEMQRASGCLRESALLLMVSSDYEKSFTKLKQALRIDNKNVFLEGEIITLSILSRLANQAGKTKESEKYYRKALNLSKSSDSLLAQSNAFFSAAEFNLYFGNIKETIDFYEKALSLAEKANDKKLMSQILVNLGFSYLREGNIAIGLQKEKESLAKAEEIGDKRAQAIAYNGIGSLNVFMNEKRTALDIFQKAEAMYPDDFDWLEKGKLLNGIATIYEDYGEFNLAEKYTQEAFELFGKANYPYGQLATLPSLANLRHLKGDKISGKKLYDEALILAQKLKSNFHLAIIKEDLGHLDFESGFYDSAIKNFQEALQVYQRLKIKLPRIQTSLGKAYAKKGNLVIARNYFTSALEINRQTKDMLPAAENLYNLAKLSHSEGQVQVSLEQIKESLTFTESLYRNVVNNKLRRSYFFNVFDRYELYINLLMKMHKQTPNENYALEALQAAEKSRARLILENLSLSEANFIKDANVETVKHEKEIRSLLNLKADKLTDLLSQNANKTETEKISDEINELEHELEETKAKLKESSPIYSAIKNPAPFEVAEFQKAILDENSLLLEFSFGKEESYLWLVSKTEVNSYILPPREQIEAKIQKLRELLASRQKIKGEEIEAYQARIAKADNDYWQAAKQLSDELFGQVADKFEKKRLIIVPDGKLNYFSVSALPLPNSENNEPLLLSNEVVYEPSASTLSILARSQNQTSGATKNLLVFSDPVFTKEDSRISATQPAEHLNAETASPESFRFVESLNSLSRLPASKTEADSIIDILGQSYTDNYSGFAANREQLLNINAADYKIFHFATHGLINEERPELSGIVLSRFDENGQKMNEFVRLHDIYGMNLNSDLVVLSACSTGIGKEVRGEGLQSLNNAFLQTGAKSVMSSLWKVEDNATLELMKNFYQSLANENATPSKALQQAQIKMWQSGTYKSPFYWAAFTVQGDFRRAPDFSRDLPYAIVFSAAGLGALVFGMFWLYGKKRGRLGLLNRK